MTSLDAISGAQRHERSNATLTSQQLGRNAGSAVAGPDADLSERPAGPPHNDAEEEAENVQARRTGEKGDRSQQVGLRLFPCCWKSQLKEADSRPPGNPETR